MPNTVAPRTSQNDDGREVADAPTMRVQRRWGVVDCVLGQTAKG